MEEAILLEQKKTNRLLENLIEKKEDKKDPYELLTIEQIHNEFKIGTNMLQKMFKDPKLAVQRYTVPFKVTRKVFQDYISEPHDYLSERRNKR